MMPQNLHQKLQKVSQQIKEAGQVVLEAQGSDNQLLTQAYQQLQQVEEELKSVQNTSGSDATENSQFQQAYQQLHDTRQQIQELKENNNKLL